MLSSRHFILPPYSLQFFSLGYSLSRPQEFCSEFFLFSVFSCFPRLSRIILSSHRVPALIRSCSDIGTASHQSLPVPVCFSVASSSCHIPFCSYYHTPANPTLNPSHSCSCSCTCSCPAPVHSLLPQTWPGGGVCSPAEGRSLCHVRDPHSHLPVCRSAPAPPSPAGRRSPLRSALTAAVTNPFLAGFYGRGGGRGRGQVRDRTEEDDALLGGDVTV